MSETAVLVSGFPRSGTSLVSGILDGSGIPFMADVPPDEGNPKGYFELREVNALIGLVCAGCGTRWTGLNDLPAGWLASRPASIARERLAEIVYREGGGRPLIGVKHPTISRLFPLFQGAFADAGYGVRVVVPWRNPYTAAASMETCWGVPVIHGLLMFAVYMISGEHDTRGFPRAWIEYDAVMSNPVKAVGSTLREIGLPMPVRGAAFTDRSLDRSVPVDRAAIFAPVLSLVENVVVAIRGNAGPDEWAVLARKLQAIVGFLGDMQRSPWYALPGSDGDDMTVTGENMAEYLALQAAACADHKPLCP